MKEKAQNTIQNVPITKATYWKHCTFKSAWYSLNEPCLISRIVQWQTHCYLYCMQCYTVINQLIPVLYSSVTLQTRHQLYCTQCYRVIQRQTHPYQFCTPVLYSSRPIPTSTGVLLYNDRLVPIYTVLQYYVVTDHHTSIVPQCYSGTDPSLLVLYLSVTQ